MVQINIIFQFKRRLLHEIYFRSLDNPEFGFWQDYRFLILQKPRSALWSNKPLIKWVRVDFFSHGWTERVVASKIPPKAELRTTI
jgi:hypothetical protein